MTPSMIVHVGLPHAGMRHCQHVLGAARDELAAAGVRYLGPVPGAQLDVPLEARLGAYLAPQLDRIRTARARHGGTAVITAEQLAVATADQARAVLDRLGTDRGEARIVVTARDLGRLLPAAWQSEVERGSTEHFADFLAAVTTDPGRRRAAAVDLSAVVERWSQVVGPENVVVVTVPQHRIQPDLLWTRFGVAAGLPAAASTGLPVSLARHPAGQADGVLLSGSQLQLLRTVNECLRRQGYPIGAQRELRARLVAVWARLGIPASDRLGVPGPLRAAVREWAADDVRHVRDAGVRVVGPLTDLEPRFGPLPGADQLPVAAGLGRDVVALLTLDRFGAPDGHGRAVASTRADRARTAGTWSTRWRASGRVSPGTARPWPVAAPVVPVMAPGAAPVTADATADVTADVTASVNGPVGPVSAPVPLPSPRAEDQPCDGATARSMSGSR